MTILFVTSLPAPYRFPVWKAIAEEHNLAVRVFADQGPRRPWPLPTAAPYNIARWKSFRIPSGNRSLYITSPTAFLGLPPVDAVVIGGWDSPSYWEALAWSFTRRTRRVGFYESTMRSQRFQRGPVSYLRAKFYRLMDAVVTPGPAATEALCAMGVSKEKIYEGFNAVDVRHFHASVSMREAFAPDGPHRFIYIGQLIVRKNLESLLNAFAFLDSDATLTIVGEGPELGHLEEVARLLHLTERLLFTSTMPQQDIPELLARHDTFVLPSTEEVWGLVVNEALAAGLHVVVSENCGVVPSVSEMKGVYVTSTTVAGIRKGMEYSSSLWRGPIINPEIMKRTPEEFAGTFLRACLKGTHS